MNLKKFFDSLLSACVFLCLFLIGLFVMWCGLIIWVGSYYFHIPTVVFSLLIFITGLGTLALAFTVALGWSD